MDPLGVSQTVRQIGRTESYLDCRKGWRCSWRWRPRCRANSDPPAPRDEESTDDVDEFSVESSTEDVTSSGGLSNRKWGKSMKLKLLLLPSFLATLLELQMPEPQKSTRK